ncbi:RNA polymerase sigma factor [Pengzhenrongella sicca]|uniref:Sigma-70 family RNA polymerase sigma factor n=1 Tax=Pengzhenrongella sicca TaxID=2819238 RepID=A0A8A4ZB31_9MICO|nr:sigma-70 family RNA polymerase sigma factor [Pengzhenrongella sicca]QTE29094.1 sigma-70 family RNA polymerase sigma factor [Pengzhenrongella sicca]
MSDDQVGPVASGTAHRDRSLADDAERALVALRAGDHAPLATLVADLTPLLWHTVRAQGVAQHEAQDVVQGVWISLLRESGSIRDPRATLQWMLVTAKRAAWRAASHQRTDAVHTSSDERALDLVVAPVEERPEATTIRAERDRVLWDHVQRLPERCRALLRLVAMVDRPDYAVVSQSLGMPVGSIGPTRGRCLAKLRSALAGDPAWSA